MLKGHVFKKQTFKSEVFAFWIDTLLDKKCGIGNYGNKMNVTYSGRNLIIASGLACIRGRLVEEDTSTTVPAGTDNAYCKLVIEIDLSKENTETELNQVYYKIIKATSSYPSLTQNDIVVNNRGKYQYELARFRTTVNGITDFTDRRTYLDFNCIFTEMQLEYQEVLNELKEKLKNVQNGSAYLLKDNIAEIKGFIQVDNSDENTIGVSEYLDYPPGFNKDNCHVISCVGQLETNATYEPLSNIHYRLGSKILISFNRVPSNYINVFYYKILLFKYN